MNLRIEFVFRTIGERTSQLALEFAVRHIHPDAVHLLQSVTPFWIIV
jgi:hypothetical protein